MPSSSVGSSKRRALASAAPSLGLEDELSFGSDEDLMDQVGEIDLPELPDITPPLHASVPTAPESRRKPKSSAVSKFRSRHSKSSAENATSSTSSGSQEASRQKVFMRKTSLASTTHLLPPLPPVPSSSSLNLVADMYPTSSQSPVGNTSSSSKRGSIMGAFKVKGLRKFKDGQSSHSSLMSQSSSSTLSLQMSNDASSRPSLSLSQQTSSILQSPLSTATSQTTHEIEPIKENQPLARSNTFGAGTAPPPKFKSQASAVAAKLAMTSAIQEVPSHHGHRLSVDLERTILPPFPASVSALDHLTILTANTSKRAPTAILSDSRRAQVSRWTPCVLVFTLFKVTSSEGSQRTVAHLHVLNPGNSVKTSQMRRSKYTVQDSMGSRVELERHALGRDSTASVNKDLATSDGRSLVLGVSFGGSDGARPSGVEWLFEMRSEAELNEWIRTIRKTAILIKAEELGYGQAITNDFESTSVSASDLAGKLSVHARQANADVSDTANSLARVALNGSVPSISSATNERRLSLEAVQPAGLSRSRSVEDVSQQQTNGHASHKLAVPTGEYERSTTSSRRGSADSDGDLAFSSSGMIFPVPPTDLPSPVGTRFQSPPPDKVSASPLRTAVESDSSRKASAGPALFGENVFLSQADTATPRQSSTHLRPGDSDVTSQTASVHTNNSSGTSSTSRLRRLRTKPKVVDVMAEFSQIELENMPPEELDEPAVPIVDDRERKIRFA